jgi:hypothetical protein
MDVMRYRDARVHLSWHSDHEFQVAQAAAEPAPTP